MQQLTLGVGLRDRAVFDSFLEGNNRQAVAALRDMAAGGGPAIYLHRSPMCHPPRRCTAPMP